MMYSLKVMSEGRQNAKFESQKTHFRGKKLSQNKIVSIQFRLNFFEKCK